MKFRWQEGNWRGTWLLVVVVGCGDVSDRAHRNVSDHDPNGCWSYYRGLPRPDVLPPGQRCVEPPFVDLDAPVLYASCDLVEASPTMCDLAVGDQYCNDNRWTSLCQHNSDCLAGYLCTYSDGTGDIPSWVNPPFGSCERACTTDLDCVRCDMACHPESHVCVDRRVLGGAR